jgi:drug/metabolite transporter (DMT)-like permease
MFNFRSSDAKLTYGYAIALISAAILSTTAIFIRYLTQTYHVPPLVLAFWRDVFVVLTLLLVLTAIQPRLLRVNRQHLVYLLIFGFVLAMFNAVWTLSVSLNGAAISTVLVYSSAGFTALLGWWLLNERLDWAKALAVVLCLAGCVLVSEALEPGNWRANGLGILTGVISGLCYAAYSLMGRSASQRGLNPWTTLFYTFGFATVFLLLVNLLPKGILPGTATHLADFFWLQDAVFGWVVLFLLAAGPTVAGYGLYNVSLSRLPSSVVNLIATLEPVFTAIIAYFLLGELLNAMQIAGSLMIMSGVVVLRLNENWPLTFGRFWAHRKSLLVRARNQ